MTIEEEKSKSKRRQLLKLIVYVGGGLLSGMIIANTVLRLFGLLF